MGDHFQGGNAPNYTIGGTRFWFNELLDPTTSPPRYNGFIDLGNVVENEAEQDVTTLEHFTSKSGTRRKDRELVSEISDEITLTLDEPNIDNVRIFMRGGDITDVADSAGNTVTGEVLNLVGTEVRILGRGYEADAIVVTDLTGSTTYDVGTDYEVVNVIGGYKGVRRIDTGTIPAGDFVSVSYEYDIRAHKRIAPSTKLEFIGQGLFFGVSDTGNEFIRSFNRIQLEADGSFSYNDEDWSQFQLIMRVLDDSSATPSAPFGVLEHYGVGTDL